jgi:hypothetical protein
LAFRQSVLNAVGEVSDALVSNESLKVQEQKATEQVATLKTESKVPKCCTKAEWQII